MIKNTFKIGSVVYVNDKMQKGYSYKLTAAIGQNFSPDFKPDLTPIQMLEMGVFEGHYMTDCLDEFPASWFKNAKINPKKADIELNFFKVKSRQPLQVWQNKNWIYGDDIRGWFQWYCRYYLGRRDEKIDAIQIKRWKAFVRHKGAVMKNCVKGDVACRPRQRQALLQWAYDPMC